MAINTNYIIKILKYTILLCLALHFKTCASSEQIKEPGDQLKKPEIVHKTTYSLKGTRSEAIHGHLYINEKKVHDIFSVLVYGKIYYKFFQRKSIWGRDGYFPIEGKEVNIPATDRNISSRELAQGWYSGTEILKGTPDTWLYAEWNNGSGFFSAEALDDLANTLHLKPIPRIIEKPVFRKIKK